MVSVPFDRVLVAERPALNADDEPELLDVPRQVGEGEAGLFAFVAVEKLERLEIAEKLEAGALPFGQRIEVRAGLFTCSRQVASGALLLNQEDAGPEQIDVAGGVVEPLDVFLVPRHVAAALAEDPGLPGLPQLADEPCSSLLLDAERRPAPALPKLLQELRPRQGSLVADELVDDVGRHLDSPVVRR